MARRSSNPSAGKAANLVRAVLKSIESSVDVYGRSEDTITQLDKLTVGERALFAMQWCDNEVRNGGFYQFFCNSTGVLAKEAMNGFRLIGANDYAELLSSAFSIFPRSRVPLDREQRAELLSRISPPAIERVFDPLEREFYRLNNHSTQWVKAAASYIRSHPDQFVIP